MILIEAVHYSRAYEHAYQQNYRKRAANGIIRAARAARNPRTGEEIQIAASKSVSFKPGKALKDEING